MQGSKLRIKLEDSGGYVDKDIQNDKLNKSEMVRNVYVIYNSTLKEMILSSTF